MSTRLLRGLKSSLLDGLAEGDVLPVVDEQRVVLVVDDYVIDAGEAQRTHGVAAITGWVDVEVLTAGGREGEVDTVMHMHRSTWPMDVNTDKTHV